MKETNKRVCLGLIDVTSRFQDLKAGLGKLGYEVDAAVLQNNKEEGQYEYEITPAFKRTIDRFFGKKLGKKLNEGLKIFHHKNNNLVRKIAEDYDVFIFLWYSFNRDFSDIKYLKEKGKKVIVLFVGDDVRWHKAVKQDFRKHELNPVEYPDTWYNFSKLGLKIRLNRLRVFERYADVVFSRREQSQLQLRPFYQLTTTNINLKKFEPSFNQRKDKPLIIHAPTNPKVKGTTYLIEALNRLEKEKIPFDFKKIEGLPYDEALNLYKSADIIVDQLLLPGGGKLSSEGMAFGKVVVSRMALDKYKQGDYQEECPIVDASPQTIYFVLKDLISDYGKRVRLAKKGREYAEKYLDIHLFCNKLHRLIQGENIPFDHYPLFFREEYHAEQTESYLKLYNNWTEYVKDCNWYSENIKEGERDGLIF